jgi:large subunit ribosomal protein L15
MHLGQLRPPKGAKKERKRIGRGNASGQGTYAGKGMKGQQARSGKALPYAGFEGGQWPLIRKMSRKGFVNPNRVEYELVKVGELARFDGVEVGPEQFIAAGLVKRDKWPVKVLSTGEITRALTVRAHKFSKAAEEKIVAAGGRAEWIGGKPEVEPSAGAEAGEAETAE